MNNGDIYAKVAPEKIDMLTKFVEAYENLGIVSTINHQTGLVIIRGTVDTFSELKEILTAMPFAVEIIEDN